MGSFGNAVQIEAVRAQVNIVDQAAVTTLEVTVRNPGPNQVESIFLLPVPAGAAISSFMFDGSASQPTAQILARDDARRAYDEIVRRLRDPALLEFAGWNLLRSSVFPVAPGATQRVRVTYEHVLERDGARIDYVLPRSEALDAPGAWTVDFDVRLSSAIASVYSPTHRVEARRRGPDRIVGRLDGSMIEPGAFQLSCMLADASAVAATLFAYPDYTTSVSGHFLLIAALPEAASRAPAPPREVTLVLDRSGSMTGGKLDQVKAAALQTIEGLGDGEFFNIIDYSTTVASFSPVPVRRSATTVAEARHYLQQMRPSGGTNIYGALRQALAQEQTPGALPIVLFLTDGLPTVGQTSEIAIRDLVEKENAAQRRVFAFGVGADVNVPLLDRIAEMSRARSTYVLPDENVEVRMAEMFERLSGPVIWDLAMEMIDAHGHVTTRRIADLVPETFTDLFAGEDLIILGRYTGQEPLHFRFTGVQHGKPVAHDLTLSLSRTSPRNGFVPRLWATRRIAYLVDQARALGASEGGTVVGGPAPVDPRLQELTDEIIRLSAEYGVLTEYTAFLATEGSLLNNWSNLQARGLTELDGKALKTRSGNAAVSQSRNVARQKEATCQTLGNWYVDENFNRIDVYGCQTANDRNFFKQEAAWVDGRLLRRAVREPDETIDFGTEAHRVLLDRLITEGRQGLLALDGDILVELDARVVLVRNRIPAP